MIALTHSEIKKLLENLGIEVHEQLATKDVPHSQLTFAICEDAKNRPIYVSLIVHPINMGDISSLLPLKSNPSAYHRLQLFSPLPFQYKAEAGAELARFLLMINKSIEYPGFECSEADKILYFKMAWPIQGDSIDEALLATQIYYIASLITSFAEPIEAIGNADLTIQQYLEKIL